MSDTAAAELMFRPVTELAGLVRDGSLSARELVEASLARIEELNPRLNAFVDVDAERALAAADRVGPGDERPFAGVPIAIKNNRAVAGLRLTKGTSLLAGNVVDHDHNVTRRLTEAGFIVVGTTTLPEFGIVPVTESRLLGPTRNPWDTDRTPGGSSGGSAAAVASGMVPIAHANDGGGSTRIPAACCGLVGLKAQRGRVSDAPEADSFLVVDGVLTRTVAESAAVLDVLAGPEVGDATWGPPPAEPFAVSAARAPQGLRIAVTTTSPLRDATVHEAGLQAVGDTVALLQSLGHTVEEVEAPWQDDALLALFTAEFSADVSSGIAAAAQQAGREVTEADVEALSWFVLGIARQTNAIDALGTNRRLQSVSRDVIRALAAYDAVLLPMLAEPPVPIGEINAVDGDPMQAFLRGGQFTPFSALFNVSGQPAISLPLYAADGLPLAVQIAGRPAQEGALLALAAQLEAARPWGDRRPTVS
jgi:amidase